jgi:hypothetical protein
LNFAPARRVVGKFVSPTPDNRFKEFSSLCLCRLTPQISRARDTFTISQAHSGKTNFIKRRVLGVGYICLLGVLGLISPLPKPPSLNGPDSTHSNVSNDRHTAKPTPNHRYTAKPTPNHSFQPGSSQSRTANWLPHRRHCAVPVRLVRFYHSQVSLPSDDPPPQDAGPARWSSLSSTGREASHPQAGHRPLKVGEPDGSGQGARQVRLHPKTPSCPSSKKTAHAQQYVCRIFPGIHP